MAEIDLTPTEEMAANAARGLELRRKHGKGGTEIGVARARDISNRKNLSPETVRRMHAFFSRHEKNKAGGEDDAGYIAWLLWGGDSGQSWAKRKVEQMDKGENQRSDTYKEIAQRLGSAAKMARPVVVDTWNAGHAVVTAELMPDHVGPSGVMPGAMWTGAITAKDRNGSIDRIAFTNPYKNMENAKRALMAEIAKIKASDMWRPRSKNDRPGAKAKMALTPIRVTEAEYAALAARDAVSRKILGDSQYQITPSDRAIRAAGDAAYKTALARHNAWDKAWRDAPNDAARAEVEARAKAAEAGMRVYRGSRPGAKAKFAFKVGDRVHAGFGVAGGAGVIGTITKIEDGYAHIQGDASALDRYGPKTYKARLDRLTAPPKKAWESSKNAVREGEKVSASDDAVSRKIRKLMDEGKPQKQAVAIALDLERRGEL